MSLDANIYIFSENPPFSTLNKGKYGIPPDHKFTRKANIQQVCRYKKSSIIAIRIMEDNIM